jgi:hypothetical protein
MIVPITQEELERLLKESEQIAKDWNTYIQFRRNRDAIMKEFIPEEVMN